MKMIFYICIFTADEDGWQKGLQSMAVFFLPLGTALSSEGHFSCQSESGWDYLTKISFLLTFLAQMIFYRTQMYLLQTDSSETCFTTSPIICLSHTATFPSPLFPFTLNLQKYPLHTNHEREFPIPGIPGNTGLQFPSRMSGMEFATRIPVPENGNGIFHLHSHSRKWE